MSLQMHMGDETPFFFGKTLFSAGETDRSTNMTQRYLRAAGAGTVTEALLSSLYYYYYHEN